VEADAGSGVADLVADATLDSSAASDAARS
jgi:hypothetical protein